MNRLLIIDDDNDFRGAFATILNHKGYQCFEAKDGFEGLIKVSEVKPDVVLLDVDMPDLDGLEVCRRLKSHPNTRKIPVIFISGINKYLKQQLFCLEIGGDAYLNKPPDTEVLLSTIQKLLRGEQIKDKDLTPSNTLMPGDQLTQRVFSGYKILEFIGTCWMGTVYKTLQLSLNREVSLKVLSRSLIKDEVFTTSFEKETKLFASLAHPNIVVTIDKGREGEFYYYTTEYIEGKSLSYYIKNKLLDIPQYIQIIVELGRAVHHLHKYKIIHKFLNPNRIIIDEHGTIKLSDFPFSLSKEFLFSQKENLLKDYHSYFDYNYLEHYTDSAKHDVCPDIYSLGVIFYEMFTRKKYEKEFISPSSLNPLLNKNIDDVIQKAINSDPTKRYASVAEFCQSLVNILDKYPTKSITTVSSEIGFAPQKNLFEDLPTIKDETTDSEIKQLRNRKNRFNGLSKYKGLFIIILTIIMISVVLTVALIKSRQNELRMSEARIVNIPEIAFEPVFKLHRGENLNLAISGTDIVRITLMYKKINEETSYLSENFYSSDNQNWTLQLSNQKIGDSGIDYFIKVRFKSASQTLPPDGIANPFRLSVEN